MSRVFLSCEVAFKISTLRSCAPSTTVSHRFVVHFVMRSARPETFVTLILLSLRCFPAASFFFEGETLVKKTCCGVDRMTPPTSFNNFLNCLRYEGEAFILADKLFGPRPKHVQIFQGQNVFLTSCPFFCWVWTFGKVLFTSTRIGDRSLEIEPSGNLNIKLSSLMWSQATCFT